MATRERLREEEEEEYGGGAGGGYVEADSFKDRDALERWWYELVSGIHQDFPVYALFMATAGDRAVASFITANREELKAISGPNCCLVYFRSLDAAAKGIPWSFSEHAAMVHPLARIMGISARDLPCLVFFKAITYGEYVRIELADFPDTQLLAVVREAFSYAASHPDPFKGARAYHRAVFWRRTKGSLRASALAVAKKLPDAALMLLKMGH